MLIKREDKRRGQWTRYLYKMDLNDPKLYDIVINIGQLKVRDACEIICAATHSDIYKTTMESQKMKLQHKTVQQYANKYSK